MEAHMNVGVATEWQINVKIWQLKGNYTVKSENETETMECKTCNKNRKYGVKKFDKKDWNYTV